MRDTSAWKTDDKAWMKARQAQWKETKKILEGPKGSDELSPFYFVKKEHYKYLKSYFLTGTYPESMCMGPFFPLYEYDPDRPLHFVEAPVLLECWLAAEPSDEAWRQIKARYVLPGSDEDWQQQKKDYGLDRDYKYWQSRRRFRETLELYPEAGTLFGGLEERLYRFFGPTRCRPEDYPQLSEEKFLEEAKRVHFLFGRALLQFLGDERFVQKKPNPNSFLRYALQEWADAIVPTWRALQRETEEFVFLVSEVRFTYLVLATPEGRDPVQLEVAREVDRLLEGTDFPAPVKALIAQGRAQAEAELAKTRR